jgi:RNA polymerase sigma-70 factor, ECF subfamily
MRLEQQSVPGAFSSGASCAVLSGARAAGKQQEENAWIAEKLRARDPEIIDQLIVKYQHRLTRYLMYLTRDRDLAEDLFQETWMRVLRRGSQFKGDSQFVTWLFSIARNLVMDLRRRSPALTSFEMLTETGDERGFGLPRDQDTAFDHCIAQERSRVLAGAISSLTPSQRQIVLLRFQEELSLLEIARITRAPLSTVKARLYRTLSLLRRRISSTKLGA